MLATPSDHELQISDFKLQIWKKSKIGNLKSEILLDVGNQFFDPLYVTLVNKFRGPETSFPIRSFLR